MLTTGGGKWFFRVSVWIERMGRGFRPSVFVELVDLVSNNDETARNAMLYLGMELQGALLREMNLAFHTQFAGQ